MPHEPEAEIPLIYSLVISEVEAPPTVNLPSRPENGTLTRGRGREND